MGIPQSKSKLGGAAGRSALSHADYNCDRRESLGGVCSDDSDAAEPRSGPDVEQHRFPVALKIFVLLAATNVTSTVAMLFGQG